MTDAELAARAGRLIYDYLFGEDEDAPAAPDPLPISDAATPNAGA